jgi:hypothetical protein
MAEKKYRVKYDPSAIGGSGLRQFGGYVSEEFLRELRGERGARTYREMADNDPVIGAMLFAVTMLIRQAKWTVRATDDTPEAQAAKEFVEQVMGDMSGAFSSVISEICTQFVYGYAPMEIVWKRRGGIDAEGGDQRSIYSDGKIGVRSIALRSQSSIQRWLIDPEDGSIDGVIQQTVSGSAVCIPIEKMLLFRTTEERGNPEGRSLLRNAYRPWYFKKRIEEIEGIGIERDLAGLPVAYVPGEFFDPNADPNTKKTFKAWTDMVTRVRRDQQEGVLLPSDRDMSGNLLFDFKLLSTGGSRTFDTTAIIDRYDKRIATTVLADFIFLGQQSVGSFALSSDKTALFAAAVGAFGSSISDVFNRHFLPRLWALNALDYETMPTMICGDLEHQSLTEVADFIQKLTASGATMFPDRELENHLRDMAGFPQAPEDAADMPGDQGVVADTPEVLDTNTDTEVEKRFEPIIINNVVPLAAVERQFIYDDAGRLSGYKDVKGAA